MKLIIEFTDDMVDIAHYEGPESLRTSSKDMQTAVGQLSPLVQTLLTVKLAALLAVALGLAPSATVRKATPGRTWLRRRAATCICTDLWASSNRVLHRPDNR